MKQNSLSYFSILSDLFSLNSLFGFMHNCLQENFLLPPCKVDSVRYQRPPNSSFRPINYVTFCIYLPESMYRNIYNIIFIIAKTKRKPKSPTTVKWINCTIFIEWNYHIVVKMNVPQISKST